MYSYKKTYTCNHTIFYDVAHQNYGVEVQIVDIRNPDVLHRLIKEQTKAIIFESPCNPSSEIVDIQAICKIAKEYNLITICDNTLMTPIL